MSGHITVYVPNLTAMQWSSQSARYLQNAFELLISHPINGKTNLPLRKE